MAARPWKAMSRKGEQKKEILAAVEAEMSVMKAYYTFLPEDQVRGKTIKKLGIPGLFGGKIDWPKIGPNFPVPRRRDPADRALTSRTGAPSSPRSYVQASALDHLAPPRMRLPARGVQPVRPPMVVEAAKMTGEPSRSKTKGKEQVDPAEQAETASVFARPKRRLLRVVSGDDLQQASPFTPTPKASQPAHGAGHDARAAADGSRAQELDAFEPLSSPEDFNKPSSKPLSLGVLAPKKDPAIARASRAALAAKGQELTRQLLQRRASSAGLKGPQASTNKALKADARKPCDEPAAMSDVAAFSDETCPASPKSAYAGPALPGSPAVLTKRSRHNSSPSMDRELGVIGANASSPASSSKDSMSSALTQKLPCVASSAKKLKQRPSKSADRGRHTCYPSLSLTLKTPMRRSSKAVSPPPPSRDSANDLPTATFVLQSPTDVSTANGKPTAKLSPPPQPEALYREGPAGRSDDSPSDVVVPSTQRVTPSMRGMPTVTPQLSPNEQVSDSTESQPSRQQMLWSEPLVPSTLQREASDELSSDDLIQPSQWPVTQKPGPKQTSDELESSDSAFTKSSRQSKTVIPVSPPTLTSAEEATDSTVVQTSQKMPVSQKAKPWISSRKQTSDEQTSDSAALMEPSQRHLISLKAESWSSRKQTSEEQTSDSIEPSQRLLMSLKAESRSSTKQTSDEQSSRSKIKPPQRLFLLSSPKWTSDEQSPDTVINRPSKQSQMVIPPSPLNQTSEEASTDSTTIMPSQRSKMVIPPSPLNQPSEEASTDSTTIMPSQRSKMVIPPSPPRQTSPERTSDSTVIESSQKLLVSHKVKPRISSRKQTSDEQTSDSAAVIEPSQRLLMSRKAESRSSRKQTSDEHTSDSAAVIEPSQRLLMSRKAESWLSRKQTSDEQTSDSAAVMKPSEQRLVSTQPSQEQPAALPEQGLRVEDGSKVPGSPVGRSPIIASGGRKRRSGSSELASSFAANSGQSASATPGGKRAVRNLFGESEPAGRQNRSRSGSPESRPTPALDAPGRRLDFQLAEPITDEESDEAVHGSDDDADAQSMRGHLTRSISVASSKISTGDVSLGGKPTCEYVSLYAAAEQVSRRGQGQQAGMSREHSSRRSSRSTSPRRRVEAEREASRPSDSDSEEVKASRERAIRERRARHTSRRSSASNSMRSASRAASEDRSAASTPKWKKLSKPSDAALPVQPGASRCALPVVPPGPQPCSMEASPQDTRRSVSDITIHGFGREQKPPSPVPPTIRQCFTTTDSSGQECPSAPCLSQAVPVRSSKARKQSIGMVKIWGRVTPPEPSPSTDEGHARVMRAPISPGPGRLASSTSPTTSTFKERRGRAASPAPRRPRSRSRQRMSAGQMPGPGSSKTSTSESKRSNSTCSLEVKQGSHVSKSVMQDVTNVLTPSAKRKQLTPSRAQAMHKRPREDLAVVHHKMSTSQERIVTKRLPSEENSAYGLATGLSDISSEDFDMEDFDDDELAALPAATPRGGVRASKDTTPVTPRRMTRVSTGITGTTPVTPRRMARARPVLLRSDSVDLARRAAVASSPARHPVHALRLNQPLAPASLIGSSQSTNVGQFADTSVATISSVSSGSSRPRMSVGIDTIRSGGIRSAPLHGGQESRRFTSVARHQEGGLQASRSDLSVHSPKSACLSQPSSEADDSKDTVPSSLVNLYSPLQS